MTLNVCIGSVYDIKLESLGHGVKGDHLVVYFRKGLPITIPHPEKTTITNGPTDSRIALGIDAIREVRGFTNKRHQF